MQKKHSLLQSKTTFISNLMDKNFVRVHERDFSNSPDPYS